MSVVTYSPEKQLVAVYGSLRPGRGNFGVNGEAKATHLFTATTKDNYDLFEYCNSFPSVSLKHSDSGTPVVVDIFETTRSGLEGAYDRLEGYDKENPEDSFYNRTEIPIMLATGDIVMAWIYHIDEITGKRVEHGDWSRHMEEMGRTY
ncbi:gamma-glutamyl cyclotransferase [Vibrio phage Vp_R1]|uniref:Gamma-glutamylcyclotransferase AIG2-like domain-containing protein n=1 Tax=Vibrio phage Vp_R1 TaxID=2059867 RepID=A0A2H5BQ21_9CAUD|nr:gamma-glutamyl cyclotransferase [Vibrio phage Vp_R1]AUG88427.1 hypothetical protein VPR_063 [Vibrio phage Vp_R1]